MAREQELKLDLAPGVALPPLVDVAGVVAVSALDDQTLDAEYWDTADLSLLRVGATLRRRTGESSVPRWTLKVPAGPVAGGRVLDRIEHDIDDPAATPPSALVDKASEVTTAVLESVARLRTVRRRLVLTDATGTPVAEVDDDEVVVEVPDRPPVRFREVEVELGPAGSHDVLAAVAERLAMVGASPADPTPKLARGLAHRLGGASA